MHIMENTARQMDRLTPVPPTDIPLKVVEISPREPVTPPKISSPLPDWLSDRPTIAEQNADADVRLMRHPRTKEQLELEQQVFEIFFERFLEAVTVGEDLTDTITRDPRNIDPGRFMRWVKKNHERNTLYEEAHEIGTDLIMSKMNKIAEGSDSLEDIERSKMRLKQYEFHVKSWNKKRYGDTKQVDVNMNQVIDIRALMEQRDRQLLTLEGEYAMVGTDEVKLIG